MSAAIKTKVFAVSSGSYSDWGIETMHWSREEAEAARDAQKARYRQYQEDYKGEYARDPNDHVDEFEIVGAPPPALLTVWNKLVQS